MSGIYGVVHSETERPIGQADLFAPMQRIAHRGSDGLFFWHEGNVGLANALFSFDGSTRGICHSSDSGLTLTADARLDNRSELIERLGLAGGHRLSDAEILLAAFQRWDVGCAELLLGDFAFVIWDSPRRRLVCIRDQFGVKPLYYRADRHGLRFASEIKALIRADESPEINETKIADFLAGIAEDANTTVFSQILRVPPAHSLSYQDGALSLSRYWTLAADPPGNPGELAEMLRERLDLAVASRLRSTLPVGAMLSGGLDSSSIVGLAASQLKASKSPLLPTYSFVYDNNPALDERRYIAQVLSMHPCSPRYIAADNLSTRDNFDAILAEQDDIFFAPRLGIARQLYREAAGDGVRILLDGHGGDEVISHGGGRLQELAVAGKWFEAAKAMLHYGIKQRSNPVPDLLACYQVFGRGGRLLSRPTEIMRRMIGRNGSNPASEDWKFGFADRHFRERHNLDDRLRASQRLPSGSGSLTARMHLMTVNSVMQVNAFEVLDRVSAAAGIEARYPFWDRRLVTFCLSVPSEEIFKNGLTRHILRHAMQGLLPPAIQRRPDKTDFSPEVRDALRSDGDGTFDHAFPEPYLDMGRIANKAAVAKSHNLLRTAPSKITNEATLNLWKLYFLYRWIDFQGRFRNNS